MRPTDVLLALCLFAIYWLVLFADHLFHPTAPDCACGNEMVKTTTLRATGNVTRHVPCWTCQQCGAEIEKAGQA